ncbi:uncharacterized protein [Chelonus insularis]|uniref:uncharacterized protein isoform X2 n=1 Tax=Chelonus insularis TaxID=460826 RepID=UPI001589CBCB|nr:uncharacterized protein LOC118069493 isoform X2 [Chelonus insularis]
MTKICDFKAIFYIFVVLFIATVSTQNLSPALCGGLHSGVDRCKECSDNQTVLVKAQPLPKPFVIDSTTSQMNQMKSRPTQAWRRGLKLLQNRLRVPTKRHRPLLRNLVVPETEPIGFERTVQYAPQIQQAQVKVPSVDPNVKLAPRFHPIGDLCYKKGSKPEPVHRLAETMIITPANPPKIECYTESSPVMPLGSARFNTMLQSQTISGDSNSQIPQLLSGSSVTNFGRQRTKLNNKPRGGLISVDKTMNTNSAGSDIRMRGLVVNLNEQNSNLVRTNRFRSNMMSSGFMVNNPVNRGLNVYSGNSAVVGVAPQISGVQKTSYVPSPRTFLFGGTAVPLSRNSDAGFIVNRGNIENRAFNEESSQPPSMDSPADLVSVALLYKNRIESCKQAAENVGGINPISNAKIPEGKISYGPETIPINGQVDVISKEIPEEKLHVSEKPVIELNLQKSSDTLRSFEGPTKPVTYNELGFVEKTYDTPRFQEKSVVYESPVINPEQSIDEEDSDDSEYNIRYPVASRTIVGELVRSEPIPSEYGPTNPNFPFSLLDKPAYQPVQSWSQNINEQPKLRTYLATNKNVGHLITNTPMLPQSRNPEICYCNRK